MTKKIIVIILLVAMVFLLCGCDNSLNDPAGKTSDTKAYIKINEEIIVIDVDAYRYGAQGRVIIRGIDGKTYITHLMNVVLVTDTKGR